MNLFLVLAAGLLAAAWLGDAPPAADAAGNRLLPLQIIESSPSDPEPDATACMAEGRWCVSLPWATEVPELRLFEKDRAGEPNFASVPIAMTDGVEGTLIFWPHIVLEADGAVVAGVVHGSSTGFSGGGASTSRLELYRFPADPAEAPALVLAAPLTGSATIRACFDEDDMTDRAGACADEYELAGELALDPEVREGRPRFVLATRARTFPGRRSRTMDSLTGPPLASSDLVWADDPACSFRRTFAHDAQSGLYRPDAPLPACEDYFGF